MQKQEQCYRAMGKSSTRTKHTRGCVFSNCNSRRIRSHFEQNLRDAILVAEEENFPYMRVILAMSHTSRLEIYPVATCDSSQHPAPYSNASGFQYLARNARPAVLGLARKGPESKVPRALVER